MKNIAIFASGNGSNFEAIAKAVKSGEINANISLLVCDKPEAKVTSRAGRLSVPIFVCDSKDYPNRAAHESRILSALEDAGVEFIVLAGYMRIVGKTLLDTFEGRIINIHPSMLPDFPGLDAIEKAFSADVKQTGVTIHYIDSGVDTGPIVVQEMIDILPEDTLESLEARVHEVEHRLYVKVLKDLL
ncbi:MAG: phosphoribosylglycinamide formyltransferase [Defluviitaleaceae bacterium]|nr:phosphoribosylglycinamide formyltransferase [Defluviitaleaceae bacterium]